MNHLEIQQRDKSALRQGYSAAVRKFEIASIAAYAVTMSWLAIVLMPRMEAKPFLAFRVERVLAAADMSTPEGRARAAERAMAVVAEHPNELVRDQYLREIADRSRIAVDALRARAGGARPAPSSGR